jgi:hypothetical protein
MVEDVVATAAMGVEEGVEETAVEEEEVVVVEDSTPAAEAVVVMAGGAVTEEVLVGLQGVASRSVRQVAEGFLDRIATWGK